MNTMYDECYHERHDWINVYYGTQCQRCGLFYPDGSEPWMPVDVDLDEYHGTDCVCETCVQNHPERSVLLGYDLHEPFAESELTNEELDDEHDADA